MVVSVGGAKNKFCNVCDKTFEESRAFLSKQAFKKKFCKFSFQEIKKTLGAEDNKKLVAHHRPVLQSENESGDSEMVVVGVVLTAKQSQNDEVTKAIEMLRRNGVSCVCFTLNKDTPSPNGAKKGLSKKSHLIP